MTPLVALGFATALGVAVGGLGATISSIIDALSEKWERHMLNQKYDCPYCGEKFTLALMKEHIDMDHEEEIANQVAAAAAAAEAAAVAAAAPVMPAEKLKMD